MPRQLASTAGPTASWQPSPRWAGGRRWAESQEAGLGVAPAGSGAGGSSAGSMRAPSARVCPLASPAGARRAHPLFRWRARRRGPHAGLRGPGQRLLRTGKLRQRCSAPAAAATAAAALGGGWHSMQAPHTAALATRLRPCRRCGGLPAPQKLAFLQWSSDEARDATLASCGRLWVSSDGGAAFKPTQHLTYKAGSRCGGAGHSSLAGNAAASGAPESRRHLPCAAPLALRRAPAHCACPAARLSWLPGGDGREQWAHCLVPPRPAVG